MIALNDAQKELLRSLKGKREWRDMVAALERQAYIPPAREPRPGMTMGESYAYETGRLDACKNFLYLLNQTSGD